MTVAAIQVCTLAIEHVRTLKSNDIPIATAFCRGWTNCKTCLGGSVRDTDRTGSAFQISCLGAVARCDVRGSCPKNCPKNCAAMAQQPHGLRHRSSPAAALGCHVAWHFARSKPRSHLWPGSMAWKKCHEESYATCIHEFTCQVRHRVVQSLRSSMQHMQLK